MLTREMGAKPDKLAGSTELPGATWVLREVQSSSHALNADCVEAEVELEVWEAASEKTEEVEEEAEEERDGAYG